jgi:putrescine importer
MESTSKSAVSGTNNDPGATRLKANVLGLAALTTIGAVMMAPALGLYGNWGPMASIVGLPTPLIFLAALAISIPTAVSYALVNREMPSAGSAFTWVGKTLSRPMAIGVGLVMAAYYTVAVILQPALFGLFFNDLLNIFGVHGTNLWTWTLGVAIVTLIVLYVTYTGIEISMESALVMITIEMLVVVALTITIIGSKAIHGGLTLQPFNPGKIQGGGSAFWAAMILGILSYTGYDVISTVAEEAKAPRRLLPKATLFACVGVGVFWAINSWAFSIAEPVSKVQSLMATGHTAATPIAQQFWGWGRVFVVLTAMTAATAVYIACVIGASRALYAQGRRGTLPAWLGEINARRQVPWNAMHVVYTAILLGLFFVAVWLRNADSTFVWWAGSVVFFALITYIFVNLSNFLYFWRFAREKFNWFLNGVVPAAGVGLDGYLIYKSFFKSLWGAGFDMGRSIIYFGLVVVALAAAWALYARRRGEADAYEPELADEPSLA